MTRSLRIDLDIGPNAGDSVLLEGRHAEHRADFLVWKDLSFFVWLIDFTGSSVIIALIVEDLSAQWRSSFTCPVVFWKNACCGVGALPEWYG
jgi:hypothetical protein